MEFRGFERFIQGRPFWEMPVAVQRLCGICPVSHHLAAAKAMDRIVGGENLTPTAEKMRRLMHYGQMFQSHSLHFFHLASPDLLFGFGADVAVRNVIAVAGNFPELGKQGIMMRKYGQEIIRMTAGKKIHGTGAIPGGINKNLSIAERDELLVDLDQMKIWARAAVKIARDYTVDNLEMALGFGSFESNHMSIVRADGAMDLYDGGLRAITADGDTIFDHVDNQAYSDYIAEEVKPWSYMKFPFIKSIGPENGWYRVGPLARVNACDFIDTPEAEAARREFMAVTDGKPNNVTLAYHWTRMIETLHAIEKIEELLHDPDLQGEDLVVKGERRNETVGNHRGAARHAVPPLHRGRQRPGRHGQPDRLDDQQQRAHEPGGGRRGEEVPLGSRDHRRASESRRGRDPRLRPLPELRHARAGSDAAGGGPGGRLRRSPGQQEARLRWVS